MGSLLALKSGLRVVKNVVIKKSPEITLALGLVSGVVAIGTAIKSTMDSEDVIDEHIKKINEIKERVKAAKEGRRSGDGSDISSDEARVKEIVKVYGGTVKSLAKLYLPTIIAGTLSVAMILTSHGILRRRNALLATSLAEVTAAYNNYRDKVKEVVGEAAERDIVTGGTDKVEIETDPEGNVTKVTKTDPLNSPYARFFDSSCPDFQKSPDLNMSFLIGMQNHFNDLLRINGSVFLNEVYDELGFERTPLGAVTGWTLESGRAIDFGIFDHDQNARFVNRLEPVVLLDFNVEGVIYDKI